MYAVTLGRERFNQRASWGGGAEFTHTISAEQQRAQIWSRLQNACSPELPAGPATARERRTAEQGIAGQWGQLARCTGLGSRTH